MLNSCLLAPYSMLCITVDTSVSVHLCFCRACTATVPLWISFTSERRCQLQLAISVVRSCHKDIRLEASATTIAIFKCI